MSDLIDGFIDFSITFFFFAAVFFALDYIVLKRFIFKSLLNLYNSRAAKERKIIIILITALYFILFGSGYYAKYTFKQQLKSSQAGFSSVEEMKEINRKGFNTKTEWLESEAKRLGFKDVGEMNYLIQKGFSDKAKYILLLNDFANENDLKQALDKGFKSRLEYDNYLESEKTKGNFDSVDELKDALLKGFNNKTDYDIGLAKEMGFVDVELMKQAKAKGLKSFSEYLKYMDDKGAWLKIYTMGVVNETKGGVFLERNFFGPDQLTTRQSSISVNFKSHYVNKTSIRLIDGDIKEAYFFSSSDNNPFKESRWVYVYQINCKSETIRRVARYWITFNKSEIKKNIDQSTGRVTMITFPEIKNISDISNEIEDWEDIETYGFELGKPFSKYKKVICNGDMKEIIQSRIISN